MAVILGLMTSAAALAEMPAATYQKRSADAAAAWPAIAAQFHPETGFDPNDPKAFKGKTIHITTDNLIGYRFSPGSFPFATTLNGLPVAGTFDPPVAAAVEKIQKELGRDLGDNDDDGKWEVFAVVEGSVGELSKRDQADGNIGGIAVSAEGHHGVSAPIVRIVAAHCGPLIVGGQ